MANDTATTDGQLGTSYADANYIESVKNIPTPGQSSRTRGHSSNSLDTYEYVNAIQFTNGQTDAQNIRSTATSHDEILRANTPSKKMTVDKSREIAMDDIHSVQISQEKTTSLVLTPSWLEQHE